MDVQNRLRAFAQTCAEYRMAQVRRSLRDALHRIQPRRRARAQALELRKDVPHPVRSLAAAPDLRERGGIVVVLRRDEALEVVRIVRRHLNAASAASSPAS